MANHSICTKRFSRRDFIKRSALMAAGSVAVASGVKPQPSHADIPGVAGNRVVWVHDPNATSWNRAGYYGDYVDQDRVNTMLAEGIKELTGQSDPIIAWKQVIPDYSIGKKVAIKVNINNSGRYNSIDALPQPVNAVIAGLKTIGVIESDIYVMEPSRGFSTRIGNPIRAKYPGVVIWDCFHCGSYGHKVTYSSGDPSLVVHHSHPSLGASRLPDQLGEVTYIINMPIMKGHGGAGVTLSFKNNFGLVQKIDVFHPYTYLSSSSYSYENNPLLDFYFHDLLRQKTVLIVADALFGHSKSNLGTPPPWRTFGGKFPNSIFLGTDPVAIDSVMFDFLNAEAPKTFQSQEYLHRASELGLGVHDHWNNSTDKLYTLIDFRKLVSDDDRESTPPAVTITQPPDGARFTPNSTIDYAGEGKNAANGILPASAFTWSMTEISTGQSEIFATGVKSGSTMTPSQEGDYIIRLEVVDEKGLTATDEIQIAASSAPAPQKRPPEARIIEPLDGATFTIGQTIVCAGEGADPEAGTLPAAAFTWEAGFTSGPLITFASGVKSRSASASIPGSFVIQLTVTNSDGLTATDKVRISITR